MPASAVGTVSRCLNGAASVGEPARRAVAAAVSELDYRPDLSGRALRRGRTDTVGVLVPTIANPVFGLSLDGIESRLRESGHATIVATSGYDRDAQRAALHTLLDRGVDGVIATLCDSVADQCEPLESRAVPYVLIYNEVAAGEEAPLTETVDNAGAVAETTRRLVAAGHSRIAFLGGHFAASDRARARHAGYRQAMEAAGLLPWPPVEIAFDANADAFERAVVGLLERLRRPSALICSNDLVALQAIGAARRLGLDVPGELSVIGFDGVPMAQLSTPSLATIGQPAHAMGRAAAALLLTRLVPEGAVPVERRSVVLPHRFIDGDTFGPARRHARTGRSSVTSPL